MKAIDKLYGFINKKKELALSDKIRQMKSRIGTGLGNEPLSFVDKIKELTKKRDRLRASLFNDGEESTEDGYSFGGSPGMSSVGAIGGNTNKGLITLGPNHIKDRIKLIRENLKNNKSSDEYSSDLENMGHWFQPKPFKVFKKSPPRGLAEKVRRHKELLKGKN